MLYQIFIYPIEIILEMIYFMFDKIIGNAGISIIGVSLAIQILTLPLYNIAEKWQKVERETQTKMKPKVDKIKAAFKGDEQYMMLSTFYKQQGYHPILAMRSTVGLLIQIPFFIAAYTFLSNLELLNGIGFSFISNLGAPDSLFTIGTFTINVLPIAMTLITVISSIIYTKGFPLREKVQLHVMSLLFLVLLYNSSAGLVLYWTMNNVFALVKNLFMKAKNPLKLFYIISLVGSLIATLCIFVLNQFDFLSSEKKILVTGISFFVLLLPFLVKFVNSFIISKLSNLSISPKKCTQLFIASCFGLFFLTGIFIPSALTSSDPISFSFVENYSSPLEFLVFPLFQSFGIFLVWFPLIYLLVSKPIKSFFTWILLVVFSLSFINTFILAGDYGFITSGLQFDLGLDVMPELQIIALDMVIIVFTIIGTLLLIKFVSVRVPIMICALLSVATLCMGGFNYYNTNNAYQKLAAELKSNEDINSLETIEPVYNLSKTEKNVIVILLDMAVGDYASYIFDESPTIKEQFSGFVFYPNTLSSGSVSAAGTFAPYGGYDYLAENIQDEENNISYQKAAESVSVLPYLFSQNGFSITMLEPPSGYGDTSKIANLEKATLDHSSVDIKKINPSIYKDIWKKENNNLNKNSTLKTTLLNFSLFRIASPSLRGGLYADGYWWKVSNISASSSFDSFLNHYSVLSYLDNVTKISEGEKSFVYFYNAAPHMPIDTKNIGTNNIDSTHASFQFDDRATTRFYNANYLTYEALGNYFDYLRENDVYDNTRIILVSDHGARVRTPSFQGFDNSIRPSHVNCLLMIKDFNSNDVVLSDMAFMTNADAPYFAVKDLIEEPVNPFTGNSLEQTSKEKGLNVYQVERWSDKAFYDYNMYNVKENIFDPDNWTRVE